MTEDERDSSRGRFRLSRRAVIGAGGLIAAGALLGRSGRVDVSKAGEPVVIEPLHIAILSLAASAIIPDQPAEEWGQGSEFWSVGHRVDRYLVGMPQTVLDQVEMLFVALEHGTLIAGELKRFSALSPRAARDLLLRYRDLGGELRMVYRAVRDFVYLGWYQGPETWNSIGYAGPMVPVEVYSDWRKAPRRAPVYGRLLAPDGAVPKGKTL